MKRTQAGFTLAEVAVAILIIGVLIGGTLMGMTFYDNTRRTAVYARVEAISRATDEFIGQYSALPGDMRNAQSRLPPCDNVPAGSCRNGNGNAVTGLADQALFFSANPGAGEEDETTLFWYHLQAAGLMGGINGETVMAGGTGWGESHPAAPLRGGYHVRTMAGLTSTDSEGPMKGLFLRWQNTPYAAANASFVVSPNDARALDEKYDDGQPSRGRIQARGTSIAADANDGCRQSAAAYINAGELTCYMVFRIRESSGL